MESKQLLRDDARANEICVQPCLHGGERLFAYYLESCVLWTLAQPKSACDLIMRATELGQGEDQTLRYLTARRIVAERSMIVRWEKRTCDIDHDEHFITLRDWLAEQKHKDN